MAFVAQAAGASTASAWKAVASRFWGVSAQADEPASEGAARKRKKTSAKPIAGRAGWTRNPAFEDLSAIFEAGFIDRGKAASWLRRHVLGRLESGAERAKYADGRARSWKLAELFLKEILGMKDGRIKAIRGFSDKLAEWIYTKTDKKLYNALTYDRLSDLQQALRRVQRESAAGKLLFGLDEYRDVWLHDDGDAYLVRDLICIRVVERLHELGYFAVHPEDALDASDATEGIKATEEVTP